MIAETQQTKSLGILISVTEFFFKYLRIVYFHIDWDQIPSNRLIFGLREPKGDKQQSLDYNL